jgi:hypothetical protein
MQHEPMGSEVKCKKEKKCALCYKQNAKRKWLVKCKKVGHQREQVFFYNLFFYFVLKENEAHSVFADKTKPTTMLTLESEEAKESKRCVYLYFFFVFKKAECKSKTL